MEIDKMKAIVEAILFSAGRPVEITEFMSVLELGFEDVENLLEDMRNESKKIKRGIEIVRMDNSYQLCTKEQYYEYIYPIFDKRSKPNLSQAALETLAIISYNPKITRAEIEAIRGVNSDGTIYKLLEYELIQDVGKMDAPGKPTMYATTKNFLKMFGLSNLDELPELPRYKVDENQQIVIDDLIEENGEEDKTNEVDNQNIEKN